MDKTEQLMDGRRLTHRRSQMAELPEYPDGAGRPGEGRGPRQAGSRRVYLLWIAGIALVVLMLVLHVTGVLGPGGH
jgi:hypothetical protein